MKIFDKLITPLFIIGMILIFIPRFTDVPDNLSLAGYICLALAVIVMIVSGLSTITRTMGNVKGEKVENGELAFGRVEEISQTGTYLNNQPEVKINFQILRSNGQQFSKEITTVLPLQQVGMVQAGVVLPVITNDEQKVRLAQTTEAAQEQQQALLSDVLMLKGLTTREQIEISKDGTNRYAKIVKIEPENTDNDQIVNVKLDLELTDEGNKVLNVKKKMFKSVLNDLSEGKVIEVKYSAKYPDDVAMATEVKPEHLAALFDIK